MEGSIPSTRWFEATTSPPSPGPSARSCPTIRGKRASVFAPDGRIIGFTRRLAEADARPAVTADSGRRLAEQVLDSWIDDRIDRWKLVTSSYETKKISGRIDRSYTFERTDRRIGDAPIRTEVVIAGDTPTRLRPYVEIPQSFQRRYAEMRSWNDLLALLASLGIAAMTAIGIVALLRYARERQVRWRQPILVGSVIGALSLAAARQSRCRGAGSSTTRPCRRVPSRRCRSCSRCWPA